MQEQCQVNNLKNNKFVFVSQATVFIDTLFYLFCHYEYCGRVSLAGLQL